MNQQFGPNGVARRDSLKMMIAGALPLAGLGASTAGVLASPAGQYGPSPQQYALGDATVVRIVNPFPEPLPRPENPYVNAYLVVRGDAAALIDTGIPGSLPRIEEALTSVGLAWASVRHVILTHYHFDHMGSAPDVLARAPRAKLWVGAADVRLADFAAVQPAFDDDEIFGLKVVATPGHTPGHINVLEPATRTLFTGDNLFNLSTGLLTSSRFLPQFTWNAPLSLASLRRLQDLEIDRAFFGHGDPIEAGAAAELWKIATELPRR